ncbi:unnamed protein product [Cuscuta epithymum]|uniref:Uncharacterized protein n=1 Tax=Cuscuta epithymum TaxID=186058 RepID=A0AAV0C2Q5_9ASTE|nr:unnamed protein product [Cuscuta epithymum]CAH9136368.1 unnamed protein product [Cuscuta epithymum]
MEKMMVKLCVLTFFLLATSVPSLMADMNDDKEDNGLLVLPSQTKLEKEVIPAALSQLFFTRYGQAYLKRLGFCLNVRVCHSDADCEDAICGPKCHSDIALGHICGQHS